MTSNEIPRMRIDSPIGSLCPNSLRATSEPRNAVRRCRRTSSSSMKRPPGIGRSLRMMPYDGATARIRYDDCFVPYDTGSSSTSSGLMFLTSGNCAIWCTSSIFTRMRRPARSPPACALVWPGHATFTPSPNALAKPCASASRKPLPYASSITTETMPHEMPTIDRNARKRLRDRPCAASRATSPSIWSPVKRGRTSATCMSARSTGSPYVWAGVLMAYIS